MYKFLIPLFALALLIGCTPANDTITEGYSDSSIGSSAITDTSSMPSTETPAGFDGQLMTGKHMVTMETTMGDIVIELDADAAPMAVTNFHTLAKTGYYNGLKFHRVIPDFMIQAGDPAGNGTGGESIFGESFQDEQNDYKMVRGMVAMANRGPNTNGSQFFIVQIPSADWLQGRHTIFGRVIEGMDIVDKIATTPRDGNDMPLTPVTYDITVKD